MSDVLKKINDALPQNPYTTNPINFINFNNGLASSLFSQTIEQLYSQTFYSQKEIPNPYTVPKDFTTPIPRSIMNEYALYNFRGLFGGLNNDISQYYKDNTGTANKLMGHDINSHNITISTIIEFFNEHYPKIKYKPADFIYNKYYRKIEPNHLITLRRFPIPVTDNIYQVIKGVKSATETNTINPIDVTQVAGVTAITYLGETTGNKLEDILSFTYGLNWRELTSEFESIVSGPGSYTNQPFYSKIGSIGRAIVDTSKGVSAGEKFAKSQITTADRLGTTYANFVLGPINVVDKLMVRDRGLKFSNDIKLTFEYELKSLNYVNPKIAMIDIISNMLTMTTNNAQFFGGGHRYYGAAGYVAEPFGDIQKLRQGDFAGYIGSVVTDIETGFKGLFGTKDGNFNVESVLKGFIEGGKTLLGNIIGQFLGKQLGGELGVQATKAFISGEPTGNWHVTVGNPLNPIVSMGNMYCDNAVMILGNGLGYDDFPTEVKFEIDVKHAMPRDKGDIENMFNAGQGRIYASIDRDDDYLNLEGRDVKVDGAIQDIGTTSIQSTQSSSNNAKRPEEIDNTNDTDEGIIMNSVNKAKDSLTSTDSEYNNRLISMIIDS